MHFMPQRLDSLNGAQPGAAFRLFDQTRYLLSHQPHFQEAISSGRLTVTASRLADDPRAGKRRRCRSWWTALVDRFVPRPSRRFMTISRSLATQYLLSSYWSTPAL